MQLQMGYSIRSFSVKEGGINKIKRISTQTLFYYSPLFDYGLARTKTNLTRGLSAKQM